MRFSRLFGLAVAASVLLGAQECFSVDLWGLKPGAVELKSAGPLAFGPDGILLVGDPAGAAVVAIATDDAKAGRAGVNIPRFDAKLAAAIGARPDQVRVVDLAVNPVGGAVYLSISAGEQSKPALVRVTADGQVSKLALENVRHSRAILSDAPASQAGRRGNPRDESITDLTYIEGKVFVSGLASGASPSAVRELPFPFSDTTVTTSIEIYHAAHGRVEDNAPVRAFAPLVINGEPMLLAGFTCTPLVRFPLNDLTGEKVRGTTVAELGNRNRPLDMIVYQKDGKEFVLMANSARGVMKISTERLLENAGLSEPVRGGGTAGQPFEAIEELQGVEQLDRLDDQRAVILARSDGALDLRTIELP